MRKFFVACAGVAACAALANADIKTRTVEKSVDSLKADVVLDGTHLIREIQDLTTGKTYVPDGNGGWRAPGGTDIYDNFFVNTAVHGGTPGRLNIATVDPNTLAAWCTDPLPLTAGYLRFAIENGFAFGDPNGLQVGGCADPNETGEFGNIVGAFCTNQATGDIYTDDYFADPNVTGADPNDTSLICRHRFLWTYSPDAALRPGDDDRMRHRMLMVDGFDVDFSGRFEVTGGYTITVDWDPNGVQVGNAIYTFDVDLTGLTGGGMNAFNAGFFIMDVDNNTVDGFGNPVPGNFACGTLWEWAKGWVAGGACDPRSTYTVGTEASLDVWAEFNVLNSAAFIADPNDPNATLCPPVDPAADGDPNSLTYEDVFTDGLLVNVQYFSTLPAGRVDLSHNLVATLTAYLGPAACPGDADGDNDVDLDDLLLLLGGFGNPGPADFDGDGTVDLDDLLILLGAFGQPCP